MTTQQRRAAPCLARNDIELESNILDAEFAVEALKEKGPSLGALQSACQALRKAKLLLFSLGRYDGKLDPTSAQRLVKVARTAKHIAEVAQPAAPQIFREGFGEVLESLECHVGDLGKL